MLLMIVIYYLVVTRSIVGVIWCVFFFQAEDGIRDLVRSRGLGDVYKRQVSAWTTEFDGSMSFVLRRHRQGRSAAGGPDGVDPVSYTHLTLPTSDLV
mgnify:CR=1 FL=1